MHAFGSDDAVPVRIRPLQSADVNACEEILRSLPDWFGIESSITQYVSDIAAMETLVAESGDGFAGFLTIRHHNPYTSEIHVMAVPRKHHGRGIGAVLVRHAEALLMSRSVEFLEVKTLGPSRPDPHYETTRGFYEHMGFRPVEENSLWGDVNPCLILIKHLGCSGPA